MLTPLATDYLRRQTRDTKWYADEDSTVEYFIGQDVEDTNFLLELQLEYSGYVLKIKGRERDAFYLTLFSAKDIKNNKPMHYEEAEGLRLFQTEGFGTAQFGFYITDKGEIVIYGYETRGKIVPVATSVEKLIERQAMADDLARKNIVSNNFYRVEDGEKMKQYLMRAGTKINDCSDRYDSWYKAKDCYLNLGPMFDGSAHCLGIYTKEGIVDKKLMETLRGNGMRN
ncbi:MAG: hypothetical protein E6767_02510 [Dysgonomonas sp.]|nr:hypothetical protein [Dysgonomonas sp.]